MYILELNNIQEMNQEEINQAIKLLSQAIKSKRIGFDYENPIQQHCYISSGDIEGIYFPNSELKPIAPCEHLNKHHNIFAVVKYNNELGFCYSYKDEYIEEATKNATNEETKATIAQRLSRAHFVGFDEILYDCRARAIKQELEKNITALKTDVETLKHIKPIYKKDGKPFADITKCVDPTPCANVKISVSKYDSNGIRIFESISKISAKGYAYNDYNNIALYGIKSIDDLIEQVKERITTAQQAIKQYEYDIKHLEQISRIMGDYINKMQQYSAVTWDIAKKYLY